MDERLAARLAQFAPLFRGLRPRDPEIAARFDAARERLGIPRRSNQMTLEEALVVRDRAAADGRDDA